MSVFETVLVALALGCDAFAVGMGVGTRFCNPRQIFRLSFHFGLFQMMMPIAGWFVGSRAADLVSTWGPWISFALLLFIGAKMAYESFRSLEAEGEECPDPTKGSSLVMLSVATSMDALGVGFSFGILGQQLFLSAVWIGITAGIMTWGAMRLGNRLSRQFGRRMETVGGLILVAIAVKLLLF